MELQTRDAIMYLLVAVVFFAIGYIVGGAMAMKFCADVGMRALDYFGVELTMDTQEAIQLVFKARGALGL